MKFSGMLDALFFLIKLSFVFLTAFVYYIIAALFVLNVTYNNLSLLERWFLPQLGVNTNSLILLCTVSIIQTIYCQNIFEDCLGKESNKALNQFFWLLYGVGVLLLWIDLMRVANGE